MTSDWNKLEAQIAAGLQPFAAQMAVVPPPEVIARAKLATRIAADEQLLEDSDPAIDAKLRERVRHIVRQELAVRPRRRNVAGLSALAAAAMVGICVGIIHYAGSLAPSGGGQSDPLERFVTAGVDIYSADPLATMDESAEPGVAQSDTELDRLEQGLMELEEMIEGLQIDSNGWSNTL